jgi:hypothetical protein
MQKALRRGILAVAAMAATPLLFAQFGGAEGEAIIFMLSSKGLGGVSLASAATPNAASVVSQFQVLDPSAIPLNPADQPGDFFPNYQLTVLHSGPHDKMQLLTNLEGEPTVHHYYLITFKLFTLQGVRREYGDPGEAIMDVPPNVFASFFAGQDIGPNEALEEEKALVWTSTPAFPPFVPSPRGYHGELNGPNETGTQMLLDSATFPVKVPWTPLYVQQPNAGWTNGMDIKFIEHDATAGSVAQMLRIHQGATTQTFTIDGDTHFFIVQGSVNINLPGGQSTPFPYFNYAFIPQGMTFSISNPTVYDGPTPTGN